MITVYDYDLTTSGIHISYELEGDDKTFHLEADECLSLELLCACGLIESYDPQTLEVLEVKDSGFGWRRTDWNDWAMWNDLSEKEALLIVAKHEEWKKKNGVQTYYMVHK